MGVWVGVGVWGWGRGGGTCELDEEGARGSDHHGAQEGAPGHRGGPVRAHLLEGVEDAPQRRVERRRDARRRAHAHPAALRRGHAQLVEAAHPAQLHVGKERGDRGADVHHGPLLAQREPRAHHQRRAHDLGHQHSEAEVAGDLGAVEVALDLWQTRDGRVGLRGGMVVSSRWWVVGSR